MAVCAVVWTMALHLPRVNAQQAAEAPLPATPPIQFQVLRSSRIDLGDHSILMNRVAPQNLPTPTVPATAPTDAEIAADAGAEARRAVKKGEALFLSATVFDRQVSELRLFAKGRDYTFLANIDFNLLGGMWTFETADTAYSVMLAVTNQTRSEVEVFNEWASKNILNKAVKRIPAPETFSKEGSEFVYTAEGPGMQPPAEALAALDGLSRYYDVNRQRLADDYAKGEAARIEREQWLKENPPVPQDTIIYYWKETSAPAPAGTKGKP